MHGPRTCGEVAELSYSEAGAELDTIIEEFETGVVDVDRLVDQLQRATDIVDELDRRLRRTRIQVEELVPRLESVGRSRPRLSRTKLVNTKARPTEPMSRTKAATTSLRRACSDPDAMRRPGPRPPLN